MTAPQVTHCDWSVACLKGSPPAAPPTVSPTPLVSGYRIVTCADPSNPSKLFAAAAYLVGGGVRVRCGVARVGQAGHVVAVRVQLGEPGGAAVAVQAAVLPCTGQGGSDVRPQTVSRLPRWSNWDPGWPGKEL